MAAPPLDEALGAGGDLGPLLGGGGQRGGGDRAFAEDCAEEGELGERGGGGWGGEGQRGGERWALARSTSSSVRSVSPIAVTSSSSLPALHSVHWTAEKGWLGAGSIAWACEESSAIASCAALSVAASVSTP